MVELKIATENDVPYIYDMCLKFIEESPYRDFPREEPKIVSLIYSFLSNPKEKICLLAISEGVPIGILGGYTNPALFSSQIVASEVMWWIDPKFRGRTRAAYELLSAFETWAKIVGADYVQMQNLTNETELKLEAFYIRKGYKPKEISYVKEI